MIGALSLPVLAPVGVAFAGDDPKALAKARELYKDGLAREAAGKWEAALAAFKEVALVKSTPQVRYHIGYCAEKMGNYVDALGAYRLALHEAREVRAKDVEQASQDALSALEPKIPKLTLKRGEGATVADVTMDGTILGSSSIGSVMPANPGPHVIKATAVGRDPFTAEFTLADAESKTVTIALDETKVAAPVVVGPTGPGPVTEEPEPPPKTSPLKIAGFVGVGLGVVGLAVGGIFAAKRGSAISELDSKCPTPQSCPASEQDTFNSGKSAATIATAGFIGGGAALGIGLILIIAAPKKKAAPPKDPSTTASLSFGGPSGPLGASLFGRF